MASKSLFKKKNKNDIKDNRSKLLPVTSADKCPVFDVQYLGKMPARGEFGREFIAEPVESLLKLKDRSRLSNSKLTISERGFHFLDHNGPFGKEKHVVIPIHHICYGVVDDQNPKVFAIIAKTDSTADGSLYECHAYLCGRRRVASEITKWLLRTFLQVFDKLQQRRRVRLERKAKKEQKQLAKAIGLPEGRPSFAPSEASSPQSPTTSTASSIFSFEETTFSVFLEGKKNHGAAIRIARQRPSSDMTQGNSIGRVHTLPLNRASTWNGPRPHSSVPTTLNPQDLQLGGGYHSSPSYYTTAHSRPVAYGIERTRQNYNPTSSQQLHSRLKVPAHNQRQYLKKQQKRNRHAYTTSTGSSSDSRRSDSITNPVHDESEFVFIDMLQEHVSSMDLQSISENESVTTYGGSGTPVNPLKQEVRMEDVERRIRDWLLGDNDDSPEEASPYSGSVYPSGTYSNRDYRYF
ncbi:uncharacterized protein LOC117121974 [Anneissia japonica]|uniref:uncharacterized protein LOC117121974 n=1 Tax=Anneissia japonica TaxID=1529436 RepID=UPI00142590C3|nr:uncharacterized protein LOC117121974 [Anneissia japonica]